VLHLVPHLLIKGRLEPPSPLDTVRNSSVESSIMAMKAVPESPLLGERLRLPK
jgi:hypothetical protein